MFCSNSIKLFLCLCMGILITYICMVKKSEFHSKRDTKMNTHTVTPTNFSCPTGPLAIGTTMYHLIDTQRTESHALTAAHSYRELMVQIWYPAKGLNRKMPVDNKTYALADVPLSDVAQQYPVLIYSHGLMGACNENTALCEDLASHGYVIVGIAHTYASALVNFLMEEK